MSTPLAVATTNGDLHELSCDCLRGRRTGGGLRAVKILYRIQSSNYPFTVPSFVIQLANIRLIRIPYLLLFQLVQSRIGAAQISTCIYRAIYMTYIS